MTAKEVIAYLRKPVRCFAYVKMTEDDGVYVEVKKVGLLEMLKRWDGDMKIIAHLDRDGDLIIN